MATAKIHLFIYGCINRTPRFIGSMDAAIRLEDNFDDVLSKAASGLGLGNLALRERSGMDVERIRAIMKGRVDDEGIAALASALGLHGPALVALAHRTVRPEPVHLPGLHAFNTPYPVSGYEEMTVNSYLVMDPETRSGAVFDSGADASELLAAVRREGVKVEAIFLTHTHPDHIAALAALYDGTGRPPVWTNVREPLKGATGFESGRTFAVGGLEIETRLTNGHSEGGTTYVIDGLDQPVAIVGDALFCCSQGGARGAYQLALQSNREAILSLSDSCVLCPGHGPLTTVAFEKAHNPFFPEFKES